MDFSQVCTSDRGVIGDPASESTISAAMQYYEPFALTTELLSMYRAFDGWVIDGAFEFLTITRSLELRIELEEMYSGGGEEMPRALFPFFDVNGQIFYIVLSRKVEPKGIVVSICYGDGDDEYESRFESVSQFVECTYRNTFVGNDDYSQVFPVGEVPKHWL